MRRVVLIAALLSGVAARAGAQNGAAVMNRAAGAYLALNSFSADFQQVIHDSMLGTYQSRGTLVQAGVSKLAMRFTDPAGEAIVLDGEYAWVYTPSTTPGQVLRFALKGTPAYGLNLLALLLDRPAERYRITYLRTEQLDGRPADVVLLDPTDPAVPFTQATVWLDQADALPRQVAVKEPVRDGLRVVALNNVRTNVRVTAGTFTFTVPAGVQVVDQD